MLVNILSLCTQYLFFVKAMSFNGFGCSCHPYSSGAIVGISQLNMNEENELDYQLRSWKTLEHVTK